MKYWKIQRWLCAVLCISFLTAPVFAEADAGEPEALEQTAERAVGAAGQPVLCAEEKADKPSEVSAVLAQTSAGRRESPYDYPIPGDPNYISDAAFFGIWNTAENRWSSKPYFDYGYAPGLSPVEAAAREGNYDLAKEEILKYYTEREKSIDRERFTTTQKEDQLTADLLMQNFIWDAASGINPLAVIKVGSSPGYMTADVTSRLKLRMGTADYYGMILIAADKDGDTAAFNSKESGANAPYLEVKVNGTTLILPPTDDTYISARDNKTSSYGTQPQLLVEESAIGEAQPVNSSTKRAYLKFDISQLSKGDTVTSATLHLYGSTLKGGEEKPVVVFSSQETNWEEKELTYANATAQVVFSYDQEEYMPWEQPQDAGYRFEEEWFRFHPWYEPLIMMYNMTGDEKYAYTAIRYLMDYIRAQGRDPAHKKTLDVACRGQYIPGPVFQLIESEYMTAETFTCILKFMWRMANALKGFTTAGNWGTSETLGEFTIAANFMEFADAPAWVQHVGERYDSLSRSMVYSDLSNYEIALSYAYYALETLSGARKVAAELGVAEPYNQVTLERIENTARFIAYSCMPDTGDYQQGDSNNYKTKYKDVLKPLAEWLGNDEVLFVGTEGEFGDMPDFTSILFPVGRKAVMRSAWNKDALFLHTNADGAVGNHGHADDLALTVMAYGQYLLVDPLYGTYSESEDRTWLISTQAHNTVGVNGQNQTKYQTSGSMERWETNGSYDYLSERTPNTPDADYQRDIFFVRPYFWIVSDYLEPRNADENEYIQSWHMLPTANISMDTENGAARTNFNGANIQVVPVGADRYDRMEIVDGLYSEGQGSIMNAMYVEYEQNTEGNAVFDTILLPERTDERFKVYTAPLTLDTAEAAASAFDFYLEDENSSKREAYTYYLLHDKGKQKKRQVGLYRTDAGMLLAEDRDGQVPYVVLQDATVLERDSTLIQSSKRISELAVEWYRNSIRLYSSEATEDDLKAVTLSAQGGDIREVMLNGRSVNFTMSEGYVTFGGTAPKPDVTPSPTTSPTAKPSGGGSHGTHSGGAGGSTVSSAVPTTEVKPTERPTAVPDTIRRELEGHWAAEEIMTLYQAGIIQGDNMGSLKLNQFITRAEFLAMLVRALRFEAQDDCIALDVAGDAWYGEIMAAAMEHGLIEGFEGRVYPEAVITREEMAKILIRACQCCGVTIPEGSDPPFADQDKISGWAIAPVSQSVSLGLMNGMDNGCFAPKEGALREQAMAVVGRLMKLLR